MSFTLEAVTCAVGFVFSGTFLECCSSTEKLVRATTNQMAGSGAATGQQQRPQGQTANMSNTEYYIAFLYHKISAFNNNKQNPTGPKVTVKFYCDAAAVLPTGEI